MVRAHPAARIPLTSPAEPPAGRSSGGERPAKVVVSGASGFLGGALVPFLMARGHPMVRLVRRPESAPGEVCWAPGAGLLDAARLEGVDAAVHLSGEGIAAGRWTKARRQRLWASRVRSTRLLAETLARLERRPRVLVSASAVGYYGDCGDRWLTEQDGPADDFLGRLTAAWEAALEPAAQAGIRVVSLRLGVVLGAGGGALARLLGPVRLGLGGILGSGRQYMSWIALDDVLGVVSYALAHEDLSGPVNAVAPEPATNAVFMRTLGKLVRRPTFVPVPAFALDLAFGEMARATLLASARVRPERLVTSGYEFRFPELEAALRHVLQRA